MTNFLSSGSFSIVRHPLTLLLSEDLLQPEVEDGDVVEDEDAEDLQVRLMKTISGYFTMFYNVSICLFNKLYKFNSLNNLITSNCNTDFKDDPGLTVGGAY